jgi:hypothetical protein
VLVVGATRSGIMMSGRTDFRNRVSASAPPRIPSHGRSAAESKQKRENNPIHSRQHQSKQGLARKVISCIPKTRLTRRAKQGHDGIIATIVGARGTS